MLASEMEEALAERNAIGSSTIGRACALVG